ncbi:MAG: tetratricopeptide repeat protein [Sphingobacteriales bacterium]
MKFNRSLRQIVFFAWFAMPLLSFGDDQAHALFLQGNAFYTIAQYSNALNAYHKLLDEGYQSTAVYFNMANAYYKNGDIPSAILYYEKAHKLSPGDEDINFNLKYANLKTADKVEAAPEFFLNRWWKRVILAFPLRVLSAWSIIFVLLASGTLVVYFFANSVPVKKTSFSISVILFFLGITSVFMASRQASYFDDHRGAIVFSGIVTVKNGPVEQSGILFVIHDGTRVDILDNNNGWLKIRLANGNEGWIHQSDVKEI